MLFAACTSRSNHRNRKLSSQSGKCLVRISGLYSVMIHARKKDFSGPTFLCFFCPVKQILVSFNTSTIQVAFPAFFRLLGVYCQHTNLRTEILGNLVNQLRVADSRRIDRNLIGAGIQQTVHITQFIDSTAYGKRNIDIGSNPFYQFRKSLTPLMAGSNIQENKFISSLFTISTSQFHRITGLAQIYKIRSFHGLSVFDVQTRYYSFC